MGVSDRPYFAWLRSALESYERRSGHLAALGRERPRLDLWVLAGSRPNPSIEFVRDALGPTRASLRFLDKFSEDPGVERVDFNDLKALPDDACDVLIMSRAAYMITVAEEFLDHTRRIVRPGGLLIVDWLQGAADAPALHLPGRHDYAGFQALFLTTYCDPQFIAEFPGEFEAFLKHLNRPPAWVNLEAPGTRLPPWQRVRRALSRRVGSPAVTPANCLEAMRTALTRAGKRLIEPELMAQYFTIMFREARYFYPLSGKFHLYLLTVLRPVGK